MKRITLTAHDGKQIAVTEYAPSGYPKGILQIVHGMVEHAPVDMILSVIILLRKDTSS